MEFLMTSDVARLMEVSSSTVVLWEKLGLLPAKRTRNGNRLFELADVLEFKARRKGEGASQAAATEATA